MKRLIFVFALMFSAVAVCQTPQYQPLVTSQNGPAFLKSIGGAQQYYCQNNSSDQAGLQALLNGTSANVKIFGTCSITATLVRKPGGGPDVDATNAVFNSVQNSTGYPMLENYMASHNYHGTLPSVLASCTESDGSVTANSNVLTLASGSCASLAVAGVSVDIIGVGGGAQGSFTATGSGTTLTVTAVPTVASFTGTGSGVNLTVSAVTGTILPGQAVTGTGIPNGTIINSQKSGTTGGAGVYITSLSTTASAAALVTFIPLAVSQTIIGTGIPVGTQIFSQQSGTNGYTGVYITTQATTISGTGNSFNDFHTRIASPTGSTTFVLDDVSQQTASSLTVYIYPRDKGGSWTGGTFNLSGSLATNQSTPVILDGTENNFTYYNVTCNRLGTPGAGCFYSQDVSNFDILNGTVLGKFLLQDGVDACGPSLDVTIQGLRGTSGDDFQAICSGYRYGTPLLPDAVYGSVHNFTTIDAKGTSAQREGGFSIFQSGFPGGFFNINVIGLVGDTNQTFNGTFGGFGNLVRYVTDTVQWAGSSYNGLWGLNLQGASGLAQFTPVSFSGPNASNIKIGYVSDDISDYGGSCAQLISFGGGAGPTVVNGLHNDLPATWLGGCLTQINQNTNATINNSAFTQTIDINGNEVIPGTLTETQAATIYSNLNLPQLASPALTSIVPDTGLCNSCVLLDTTTYYYKTRCVQGASGANAGAESSGTTTTNPAGANKNKLDVTFNAAPGCTGYNLYRSATSGTEIGPCNGNVIANIPGQASYTYVDTGSCSGGSAAPTANNSGGSVVAAGPNPSSVGGTFQATQLIVANAGTPVFTAGPALGTSPTCCTVAYGNNFSGSITFSTGTATLANGLILSVAWGAPTPTTAPGGCWLTPHSATATAYGILWATRPLTSSPAYTILSGSTAMPVSTAFQYDYHCL